MAKPSIGSADMREQMLLTIHIRRSTLWRMRIAVALLLLAKWVAPWETDIMESNERWP